MILDIGLYPGVRSPDFLNELDYLELSGKSTYLVETSHPLPVFLEEIPGLRYLAIFLVQNRSISSVISNH